MAARHTLVSPPLTASNVPWAHTQLLSCNVRFEVLLVVTVNITVIWAVMT